jgi:hypothetical protein
MGEYMPFTASSTFEKRITKRCVSNPYTWRQAYMELIDYCGIFSPLILISILGIFWISY